MATSSSSLLTRAERTGYAETSRHADVSAFLRELRRRTDLVRVGSMGKSAEGRDVPVVVASARSAFTPARAHRLGRPIVMIQANIHAGEVEGKEAVLALLRDLTVGQRSAVSTQQSALSALSPTPPPIAGEEQEVGADESLLERLTLVVVPILNPDGNERISPENRKLDLEALEGQIGPPGGVGTRNTGEGWNLNRDYMKQEATESNNLARLYGRWWPQVFVDCHTTDGSIHAYDMTFDTAHTPLSGHPAPIEYVRRKLLPAVSEAVLAQYGRRSFFYGNYRDQKDPTKGWETYPGLPRFGSHYRGLTGRLDILLETYSYIDFKSRVETIYAFLVEILRYVASHNEEVLAVARQAEQETIARGADPRPDDLVAINYGVARRDDDGGLVFDWPVHYLEDAEIVAYDRPSLRNRRIPGRRLVRYRAPHHARFIPTVSVPRPYGYIVTAREIAGKLRQHNVEFGQLTEDVDLEAEAYVVLGSEKTRSPDICTGIERYETVLTVRKERRRQGRFQAGDLLVLTGQRLGNLVVYLLEPESDDGLARWEYFDSKITLGGPFPAYRLPRPVRLPTRRVLRTEGGSDR